MRSLYSEAETALNELAGLQRSAELSSESLRLTTMRYQGGEATVLEVVDAQTTFFQASAAYQDGAVRESPDIDRGADVTMKKCIGKLKKVKEIFAPGGVFLLAGIALMQGCGGSEKEPTPLVAVQVTPVKRDHIELEVSSDAVVYPLQQAVITPKITSSIAKFYVQRGSHVKQGQLLALLENKDLAGAAEQSKGEFEQAEAGYNTTTGGSLP